MYECGYFKESYSHRVVSPKEVEKFIDALAGCEVTEGGIIYGRTYYSDTVNDGKVNSTPSFKLDKDGKFEFSPGFLSSYLGIGSYRFDGVRLTLKTANISSLYEPRAQPSATTPPTPHPRMSSRTARYSTEHSKIPLRSLKLRGGTVLLFADKLAVLGVDRDGGVRVNVA